MACIAPPPPAIEATVQVAMPSLQAQFTPTAASSPYMDGQGNLDLSCFNSAITIVLHISPANPDLTFYAGYNGASNPVIFLDDAAGGVKQAVQPGHHQFKRGVTGGGTRTISFVYSNHSDGGQHDGVRRFSRSKYGLRLANAHGYLGEVDPIVNNGGNND
jgi:hypothetical protein